MADYQFNFENRKTYGSAFSGIGCLITTILVAVAGYWTAGLLGLTVHVACAFHFLLHWSHAAALKHTAQRTAEVTGWASRVSRVVTARGA